MVRRRYVRKKPHGLHHHCSSVAVSVHATAVSWSKLEQDIPHLSNLAATISTRAVLEAVLTERGCVLGGQATSGLDGEPVAAIQEYFEHFKRCVAAWPSN